MAEDLTRWEYKYWTTKENIPTAEKKIRELNELGKDGWEATGNSDNSGILLKRPIKTNQPQRNVPPYNPPYNGR